MLGLGRLDGTCVYSMATAGHLEAYNEDVICHGKCEHNGDSSAAENDYCLLIPRATAVSNPSESSSLGLASLYTPPGSLNY